MLQQQHALGNTNLLVSPMGLGLAALGRPGYINLGHQEDLANDYDEARMEQRAHQVLDTAWAVGIRYFDVARSYGRAEAFLHSWLTARQIQPNTISIGSKWGYTYTADWQVQADKHEVKEHTLNIFQYQIEETRNYLGDHLDLYQIHSATLDSGVLENNAVLEALAHLKLSGIKIGLSVSGTTQAQTIEQAIEARVDGVRLFDTVQLTWNLLEQSTADAARSARDAGLGIIIKEALANGRLTDRNQDAEFATKKNRLQQEADRLGTTIDALALAAVLAQPWVDVVLSGATTTEQLQSNLSALQLQWDDASAKLLVDIMETPEVYWSTRAAMPWN